jgi:hypothetical protein
VDGVGRPAAAAHRGDVVAVERLKAGHPGRGREPR